jgi:hypothetical protein
MGANRRFRRRGYRRQLARSRALGVHLTPEVVDELRAYWRLKPRRIRSCADFNKDLLRNPQPGSLLAREREARYREIKAYQRHHLDLIRERPRSEPVIRRLRSRDRRPSRRHVSRAHARRGPPRDDREHELAPFAAAVAA